jgi:putative LysE/RhtB family amino acid efflux pump
MLLSAFLKGIAIGFSTAAPVGPIGVLCIRRTIENGRRAGLVTGLGAAVADVIAALIAVLALSLGNTFSRCSGCLHVAAGMFLVALGARMLTEKAAAHVSGTDGATGAWWFGSTFVLTLANPMTVLSFVAIYAAFGAAGNWGANLVMALGVFVGSMSWWMMLSGGVEALRLADNHAAAAWIGRISGGAIAGFGLWALVTG